jgi:oligopeptide transport system substrate-binding protein
LPEGPGSKLLFSLVRSNWAAIGVQTVRVGEKADADLRLVDAVSPSRTATWYLRRFACERSPVCSEIADDALGIARTALNPIDRAARIADADLRLTEMVPFIPIAQPLRWSLVSPRLTSFKTNNRGVHPLNHLIADNR